LLEALSRASAPSEVLTFCLLTRTFENPGSSSAGRFSADIANNQGVVNAARNSNCEINEMESSVELDEAARVAIAKLCKVANLASIKLALLLVFGPLMFLRSVVEASIHRPGTPYPTA
jgi:hypothetical protein